MYTHSDLESHLLSAYKQIRTLNMPEGAVHKRNSPSELVIPTIPFVGKHYVEQQTKILVYASAENLSGYWKGNDKHWPGDWLDCDELAQNRHRWCFDNESMQADRRLPFVHLGPLEDGGLLAAVMFLSAKLRSYEPPAPREFYETIAFGNYCKYSIETEFQHAMRDPQYAAASQKKANAHNIDYAAKLDYIEASKAYVRADIETLQPDYIIVPNMNDSGFLNSIRGRAKIIRIHQINASVVNNIAPNKRNHHCSKYTPYDPALLPAEIRATYNSIMRINHQNYLYIFSYLDAVLEKVNVQSKDGDVTTK